MRFLTEQSAGIQEPAVATDHLPPEDQSREQERCLGRDHEPGGDPEFLSGRERQEGNHQKRRVKYARYQKDPDDQNPGPPTAPRPGGAERHFSGSLWTGAMRLVRPVHGALLSSRSSISLTVSHRRSDSSSVYQVFRPRHFSSVAQT